MVASNVKKLKAQKEKLHLQYKQELDNINLKIKKAQKNCNHDSHNFNGDPAGGNDSYFECNNCGYCW